MADGTLIIGSLGHGYVSRVAPGKVTAVERIKPGTGGLNAVLGVFADEKAQTFWVCSNNFDKKGEATSVNVFDLRSGEVKGSYPLPGEDPLCNDMAVAVDGTAYVSDTNQGSVLMLKPGSKALEIAAKDSLLAGATRDVEDRYRTQGLAAARPSGRYAHDWKEPASDGRELRENGHRNVRRSGPAKRRSDDHQRRA
jgi:streptogramin lyase